MTAAPIYFWNFLFNVSNKYLCERKDLEKSHIWEKISEKRPLEAENWSFYCIFGYSDSVNKHLKLCELQGSAKGKYEIVKLLLKHGADPTKKNRDGHTPMDLVKEGM